MATPREVRIDLSSPFPYRAGAEFFSTIAYPHPAEGALRGRFSRSLCRWQVLKRALEDQDYATRAQLIPPTIFTDDYTTFWKAVQKGIEKLRERMVATVCVAAPYVADLKISGQKANISKLSKIGAQSLGKESESTFITDVWTDTKSVAHATLACLICHFLSVPERLTEFLTRIPDTSKPDTFEQLQKTVSWNFEEYLENPISLWPIIDVAEQLRSKLPGIKRSGKGIFKEESMIKFLAVLPNDK
jgi:hypothetical protein